MPFHCVGWAASLAAGPDLDTAVVPDDVLPTRNNHLIVTDPYRLLIAQPIGALITRQRFGDVGMTVLGQNHLWPVTVSATQPTNPQFMDRRDMPVDLPMNEEITIQSSNSGAGPTATQLVAAVATQDWNLNLPAYLQRLTTRATVVIAAGTVTTWTALATLAMERDLMNGVYSVVGAYCVGPGALAFRIRFPDAMAVNGKQHRPGAPVQQSATTQPNRDWNSGLGEWGRFHTFSLPQVQTLADAAGGTYELRLDLLYMGSDKSLLYA